jgi:hypothetical protein
MEHEDFTLTPEETRWARRKRRILVIGAFALLLVILAAIFGARPAAGAIRTWQARRHAQRAFAYIDKEKWDDARSEAVAAYQLRPTEPQALRAVARFQSRTHQIEALDFWKQLAERTSLTHQDVRDEAMIAIIAGDTARANAAVRELVGSLAEPADWLLAAQLSIQKNLRDEAKPYLEKIVADSRSTESEQFRATLLQLALTGNNQTERANAVARLKKIAAGKTATSLDSLVVLAQMVLSVPTKEASTAHAADVGRLPPEPALSEIEGGAPPPQVPELNSPSIPAPSPIMGEQEIADLVRALDNHPLATAQHKLLALDLRLHLDSKQRDAIVRRAIKDWKDAPPTDLASLAAWLNTKAEFQRTLDTVPLSKAMQSRDLFLQYLDAQASLGRWSEVKGLLTGEKFPLDPVVEQMYLARCSSQLGEKTAAGNSWQRALEAAGGDVRKLMMLAQYAEKNGNAEIAGAAYDSAAAISPQLRIAQDGRLRLAQASRETKKLHAVLAEMLALWPNDPAIQNDEAYTRLLLFTSDVPETKRKAVAIEELAEKLIAQEPASLPHRTLLALARLKQGRAQGALIVYSDLRVERDALSGSALAVHAAILAATAHTQDAKTEIEQIKHEELLPEERSLIESLLEYR